MIKLCKDCTHDKVCRYTDDSPNEEKLVDEFICAEDVFELKISCKHYDKKPSSTPKIGFKHVEPPQPWTDRGISRAYTNTEQ